MLGRRAVRRLERAAQWQRRALTTPAASASYDYVVIGAGSGGIASARRAAQHGAKVAIVEAGRLGGTCVNAGCVPKKLMYHAADLRESIRYMPYYGILPSGEPPAVDMRTLKSRREAYIEKLNGIYARNLTNSGVAHVHGWGTLEAPCKVRVSGPEGEDTLLEAEHVLLAPGGRPFVPEVDGVEHTITSDGFFELDAIPERAIVVGAGYIAVELAGAMRGLGSEVDMVVRGKTLLRGFDKDISAALLSEMVEAGVRVHLHSQPVGITANEDGIKTVVVDGGEAGRRSFDADTVLMATGREAATDNLTAPSVQLGLRDDGSIVVDAQQRTSVDGVYAIGDATGGHALTPVAIAEGRLLSDRLFGGKADAALDHACVPTAVFSHPPIGTVGLTQEEAQEEYGSESVVVHRSAFRSLFFGMIPDDSYVHKQSSLMKLVCVMPDGGEAGDEVVKGVHMLGPASDEIIQAVAIAVKMGATKRDFDTAVAVHPTAAEELVTMQPWTPHYAQ